MHSDTPSTYWNHRLIEHRYKDETWVEVHEIHYEDGKPWGFATRSSSPRSKWEAEKMLHAFTQPITAWVNEETATKDKYGFPDFKDWGWFTEEKFWKEETEDDETETGGLQGSEISESGAVGESG